MIKIVQIVLGFVIYDIYKKLLAQLNQNQNIYSQFSNKLSKI